ncbi:putative damage-inducible protein DinB [Paenibacillus taihuensis]|uniref:Putative damage-inducible protein DinB n=1 Tax=Paenibacillus taihuensis TaxID=1156355 RepID=A0A3D9PYX5_9BACL|nr:DinB family protein [Paenibacillus taihuensis]REE55340.1 putative damage-inducible protein DinB [Paenibacillus taihuensis]
MNQRPSEEEYVGDVGEFIRLVPGSNIIDILLAQEKQTSELLASLTERQGAYRYAQGKWTLKEVVGHIADGERVMTYRLLRFARGDKTPLTGFDQELFMSPFVSWTIAQLAEDYRAVRQSTITLLRGLPEEAWSRKGTANDVSITVRALAFGIAGHELHHMGVIRDRYLS